MRLVFALVITLYMSALGFAVGQQSPPAQPAPPSGRFDLEVRADFFAGIAGDTKRLEKAMARCEDVLATNPDHPEALVWHGAGVLAQASRLFSSGNTAKGLELWQKGLGEMARAVSLAPNNVGVRIPRGATLLETSRFVPESQRAGLLKIGVADYEHTLELQKSYFTRLSDHAKGELLFGLADGWARLGDNDKARQYFTRLTEDAAKSGRATYAKAWLEGKPPPDPGRCVGCH